MFSAFLSRYNCDYCLKKKRSPKTVSIYVPYNFLIKASLRPVRATTRSRNLIGSELNQNIELTAKLTKLDRNVEHGNFEANSCWVLWVECTLKKSNSNTETINRDYFMRHSVRFTNIEMLMIENAFCKHPWISDNISRDQKQLDDSDRIGRIGNLNTAIHFKWKGFKKSCLE